MNIYGQVGWRAAASVNPAPASTLLLDTYANSSIGFSMHKLRAAYNGSCIRVRRSSDNTTQEIGFVNNYLDTASLLSFVGAGNGFIHTWYDQSNGNNLTQLTPGNQPQIVASGSLITRNGIATIKATSTQYLQLNTNITGTVARSWWFSYEKDTTGNQAILGLNGGTYMYMDYGTAQYCGDADAVFLSAPLSINTFRLINFVYTTATQKMWSNGTQIGSNVGGTNTMTLGLVPMASYRTTTVYFNELVYWQTNQTTNRAAIETNIKTRNSIY
jgi:hypothetical protein